MQGTRKRIREALVRWTNDSPFGQRVLYWFGKTVGRLQLRLLLKPTGDIPWTPLKKPLSEATVALVTTSGVHLCTDKPFDIDTDSSYRTIPRTATREELCITHGNYDQRDAARDLNLIFPLQRLLELEQEGIIGHVADVHYGFGFTRDPRMLIAPGREVGKQLAQAGVDLALLVPA